MEHQNEDYKPTPAFMVVLMWLIVGIPLAWGVYQTFVKSLAPFQ